jgi:midasin (ATPase involved in ribosome maturation)
VLRGVAEEAFGDIESTSSEKSVHLGQDASDGFITIKLDNSVLAFKNEASEVHKTVSQIAVATKCGEPVLLVGSTTHKKYSARKWSELVQTQMVEIYVTSESQVGDLIGSIKPFSARAAVSELIENVKLIRQRLLRIHGETSLRSTDTLIAELEAQFTAAWNGERLRESDGAAFRRVLHSLSNMGNGITEEKEEEEEERETKAEFRSEVTDLACMLRKCREVLKRIMEAPSMQTTLFLFSDGPVSKAVKAGAAMLLHNIDKASQAVVERFNPLFEIERTFQIPEDPAFGQQEIAVLPSSCIIATAHTSYAGGSCELSPAIRSRFTTISVDGYSDESTITILHNQFKRNDNHGLSEEASRNLALTVVACNVAIKTIGRVSTSLWSLKVLVDMLCFFRATLDDKQTDDGHDELLVRIQ